MNLIILLIILGVAGLVDFPEGTEPHINTVNIEKVSMPPRKFYLHFVD